MVILSEFQLCIAQFLLLVLYSAKMGQIGYSETILHAQVGFCLYQDSRADLRHITVVTWANQS